MSASDTQFCGTSGFTTNRIKSQSTKLTAQNLITIKTSFFGYCEKKSPSWLNYCFPCVFPLFKRRFLVSTGNYIFRFADENGEKPKGLPIPIDSSEIIYSRVTGKSILK